MKAGEVAWRKASRSHEDGDACVEVAVWRKASRSKEDGSNCVELATTFGLVAIRDSKAPDGPKLIISGGDFRHLASVLKNL